MSMGRVRVTVVGDKEVAGHLHRLQTVGVVRIQRRVNTAALALQRRARELCPVDTGRLRSSIGVKFLRSGSFDGMAADVGTNVKYAPAIEFGSGLHGPERRRYEIRPVKGKALRWRADGGRGAKKGAVYVFARKVMHPGVRPQPFLLPAWEEIRPGLIAGLKKDLEGAAA